jgi:hypothetical protein
MFSFPACSLYHLQRPSHFVCVCVYFMARQPPSGPGPPPERGSLITLRHKPHSVGLLCTSDQPDAETSP